jgi:hypothetical protein
MRYYMVFLFLYIYILYFHKDSIVESIDDVLTKRKEMIKQVKIYFWAAQNMMAQLVNKKRSEMSFSARDYVYIKIQQSLVRRSS